MSEGGIGNPAARIVEAISSKVRTSWQPVSSVSRCDAASRPRRPLGAWGGPREPSTDGLWLLLALDWTKPPTRASARVGGEAAVESWESLKIMESSGIRESLRR